MNGRVRRTLSILLLSAMTGCASGPFHRKAAPAPVVQPAPPELSQTPLYSPEMSDDNPHLPSLPNTAGAAVIPAPEPVTQKPRHTRKSRQTAAPAKTASTGSPKAGGSSSGEAAGTGSASTGSSATGNLPAESNSPPQISEKKQGANQVASSGANSATSPIGELTTGSSADAAQTSHQTEDLIKSTRDGLESVKRALTDEEKKTAAEIRTFLVRAQQALKNGDVDGAFGLATKAKLLLDELTGS